MSDPLPNAFADRLSRDIAEARKAPITLAEMAQLAEDNDLPLADVEAIACLAGFDLRATAEAVWIRARRGDDGC